MEEKQEKDKLICEEFVDNYNTDTLFGKKIILIINMRDFNISNHFF